MKINQGLSTFNKWQTNTITCKSFSVTNLDLEQNWFHRPQLSDILQDDILCSFSRIVQNYSNHFQPEARLQIRQTNLHR